jgi:hypothetical protein
MYQVEFFTMLPGTEQRVRVIASCNSINDHSIYGLTLRFYDEENEVMHIKYDKDFFSDMEYEAEDALLDSYYNSTFARVH